VLGYALYTDDALGIWRLVATDISSTSYVLTGNVTAGAYYQFQVQAKNKWGWGARSTNGTILAATTPTAVDPLTTAIDPATGGVTLAWGPPTALGGVPVLTYSVLIKSNVGTWATEPTCDGTDATIVSTRTCVVPMANLVAAPHSLPFDTLVEVMVSAQNVLGTGPTTTATSATARIRQAPAQLAAPVEGSGTSDAQIQVDWLAATGAGLPTGNSAILSYELLWDNGDTTATTFVLLRDALATTYTVVGVTEGSSYRFTVRAVNIYGAGPDSAAATIRASDVPSPMAAVTTTRDGLDLTASFTAPATNGAAIEEYEILLWSPKDSAYLEHPNCDGAQSAIQTSKTCSFAFLHLNATYQYNTGDLVLFKARARNADGWGGFSAPNSLGSTIMTVPAAIDAPVEGAATSMSQI
jgi:hypothetical protein